MFSLSFSLAHDDNLVTRDTYVEANSQHGLLSLHDIIPFVEFIFCFPFHSSLILFIVSSYRNLNTPSLHGAATILVSHASTIPPVDP
ncbi:hypothetical protein BCR44DRAFT_1431856 [Catenaria anguillulae PL171]|uniref:Uncharacterized protein n=1 Tax=Catenaria anguillulae PL171 TaxID=765915 RepID=A0A1Y2HQF2_9FUNG|nr:hypothetical protein BCR44DRAFT_1431856 [Catenaria anguillulae PL171]